MSAAENPTSCITLSYLMNFCCAGICIFDDTPRSAPYEDQSPRTHIFREVDRPSRAFLALGSCLSAWCVRGRCIRCLCCKRPLCDGQREFWRIKFGSVSNGPTIVSYYGRELCSPLRHDHSVCSVLGRLPGFPRESTRWLLLGHGGEHLKYHHWS